MNHQVQFFVKFENENDIINFVLEIPVYDRALSASDHHQHGNEVDIKDLKTVKKTDKTDEEPEVNILNLFFSRMKFSILTQSTEITR